MADQLKVVYMIYRTVPVLVTLNHATPGFKLMPFAYAEYLSNGTRVV